MFRGKKTMMGVLACLFSGSLLAESDYSCTLVFTDKSTKVTFVPYNLNFEKPITESHKVTSLGIVYRFHIALTQTPEAKQKLTTTVTYGSLKKKKFFKKKPIEFSIYKDFSLDKKTMKTTKEHDGFTATTICKRVDPTESNLESPLEP